MAVVLATLVFFYAVPRTFGRKCPRDGTLLPIKETVVVRSRYDTALMTRPAIIQRTWACPKCDFRHAEALRDPNHRPTELIDPRFVVPRYRTSDDEFEKYEIRRREALERSVTEEQYAEMLSDAKRRAAELSSPDSPWRGR
jgi:hypothetical protein